MNRHSRNVPRATSPPLFARVLDALAMAYLVAFGAVALAGVDLLPAPFGIVGCALLGAAAVIWIVR